MDSRHYLANYEIEKEIGQGSFATVYLGHEKTTKLKVAIKAVNTAKLNKKLAENLASEITILKEIDHPNIIKLYEIQKTEHYIYLVMEYCHAGDLFQHLRRNRIIKEPEAQNLLQQLTSALKVLWDNNLIHRDLKPQNLLLQQDSDSQLILKIADFGFARYVEPTDLAETLCGSPLYMAPEILRYEKYDAKADLWSVGAIAYEMIFGNPPYRADNHVHLLRMIEAADDSLLRFPSTITIKQLNSKKLTSNRLTGNFKATNTNTTTTTTTTINIESSDILRDLILRLLKKDPNERIGFKEFFAHPFVNETFSKIPHYINVSSRRKESVEIIQPSSLRTSSSLIPSHKFSNSVSTSSVELAIEDILRSDVENLALLELFDNLERKPPIFTSLKNCSSLVLLFDKLINYESTQSMTLSFSRTVLSEQRRTRNYSTLLLLFYNIDLLENCLDLLKTAINRESDKTTSDFGNLLRAARVISLKLDQEYEVFDSVKGNFKSLLLSSHSHSHSKSRSKSNSTSSSSLTRSNSSQNIEEEPGPQIKIEILLLQAACRCAKEGGIQELLDNLEEANSKYLSAILIFNSLLKPTELAPITSKFAQIHALYNNSIINKYLEILKDRI